MLLEEKTFLNFNHPVAADKKSRCAGLKCVKKQYCDAGSLKAAEKLMPNASFIFIVGCILYKS